MNKEEIDLTIKSMRLCEASSIVDNIEFSKEDIRLLLNYIDSIQNNWNELKEHIGSEWYCFDNESVEFEVAKNILSKMQELESRK